MKHKNSNVPTDIQKINSTHLLLVDGTAADAALTRRTFCAPDGLLVFLCHKGSITCSIDGEQIACGADNFFAIAPGLVFSLVDMAPDTRYTLLFIPGDHISLLRQDVDMSYIYGMLCNEVFRAPRRAIDDAIPIFDLIRAYGEVEGCVCHFRNARREAIALALVDALAVIMNSIADSATRSGRERGSFTRQEIITRHFFSNLLTHHKDNHTVEYYAQLEGLTPKYLSTAIRQATNRTAQEWIALIVVFSAKRMLQSTDLSVSEVAARHNFTSSSAFIRFFKTNTGTTPMAFRK